MSFPSSFFLLLLLLLLFLVQTVDSEGYRSAMFWILVLYFRVFFIWFINMSQYASACNAFCKSRHKRAKQEHTRQVNKHPSFAMEDQMNGK